MPTRVPCPSCRAAGKDSKGDHLRPFDDGSGGWCFNEQRPIYYKDFDDEGGMLHTHSYSNRNKKDDAMSLSLVATFPFKEYAPRKISKDTMEFFGVRTEISESDGTPFAHWYPYFQEGEITGYKTRVLPKDFSRGITGKVKTLFGQNTCSGNNFLIIVEGEHDVLAGRDMMLFLKGKAYNIVSLPFGSNENGTLDSAVRNQFEWIAGFNKVVICLDQDVNGQATANTLADFLCSHCDVRIASLPMKDTAAMWEAGKAEEWGKAISNATKHTSAGIVTASDIGLDHLMQPLEKGQFFSFLPKTCKKINGFRPSEVTTIIAPPNVGKSSLMRQMMYDTLQNTPQQVGAFFLEETKKKTCQSILAYHCGLPLNKFRQDPSCANKEKVQYVQENLFNRLHVFEYKDKVLSDDFLERKIEYLVKAQGCKSVYLDHLSFIISGRDKGNERKEIDMLLTRLARSVEDWDYALYIVSHIKRKYDKPKKKEESYPYWNTVDLDDGRGSGGIEQLSHRMIALENQVLDPEQENTRGLLRTRVLRDREWGVIGIGDYLMMDDSGKLVPFEESYV